MRIGYADEETQPLVGSSGGDRHAGETRGAGDHGDKAPVPEVDIHRQRFPSWTEPSQKAAVNHVTTNLLTPPSQLVTCRHWFVWPAAFLFMLSYNCTFYVFGQYVYIKLQRESFPNVTIETTSVCHLNTSSVEYAIQVAVQRQAARWSVYLYLSGSLLAIFASFVLGTHTDRFGRKFLFILPLVGTTIRTAGAIVGIKYNLHLTFYMIGYAIEGCTGQIFTILQISYIYVSDITPVGKKRSVGIVVIEVAFGLAIAISSVGSGYLLKFTDFLVPFYVSLILLGLTFVLVIFLPETYPKEVRTHKKYTSNFQNLRDSFDLYVSSKNAGRRWMYIVTLVVFTLTSYNLFGRNAMEGLYLLNAPFCFGPDKLGIFGTLRSGFQQLVGMGLVAVLHKFMGDVMIAIVACVSYGVSFLLEGLATNDLMLYIVTVIGTCGLLTIPMVRSIMSQMTSPHKQGAVFASISAAECSINLVSAVTSNYVYIATVDVYRGMTFMVFASCSAVSCVLMVIFYFGTRNSRLKYDEADG